MRRSAGTVGTANRVAAADLGPLVQLQQIGVEEVVLDRMQQVPQPNQELLPRRRSQRGPGTHPVLLQLGQLLADKLQEPLQVADQPARPGHKTRLGPMVGQIRLRREIQVLVREVLREMAGQNGIHPTRRHTTSRDDRRPDPPRQQPKHRAKQRQPVVVEQLMSERTNQHPQKLRQRPMHRPTSLPENVTHPLRSVERLRRQRQPLVGLAPRRMKSHRVAKLRNIGQEITQLQICVIRQRDLSRRNARRHLTSDELGDIRVRTDVTHGPRPRLRCRLRRGCTRTPSAAPKA